MVAGSDTFFLFQNKWVKKPRGKWLTQVHLKNDDEDRVDGVGGGSRLLSCPVITLKCSK